MRNYYLSRLIIFFILPITLLINACDTSSPQSDNEEDPPEEGLSPTEPVAPDGILEAVTWNIEWYGSRGNNHGPSDEFQQTKNVLGVVDSLNADLFAFQEILNQQSLDDLTEYMTDYRGFVAGHVPYNQKMAFIYNTNTIDSISAGPITDTVLPESLPDSLKDDWEYNWANGREPLYFQFQYTSDNGETSEYYAITIHGKANTGDNTQEYEEAYQRRQKAAEGLYHYLMDEKPNANIILLGDYNDDVDQSIYYEDNGERVYQETPYDEFVNDSQNFNVITKTLSDNKESASINYDDIIDHITVSNELFDNYMDGSVDVYDAPLKYISDYGETTSDHLPVWVKFDVAK